ncbi:predicted protein [Naegleria gruberi]|uniref:Predicted protein n=1 Tax=Naegleria gruberi TaxID=5762 RepID=D2W296_NAEGR|nr:uncharacterized protein NAEGRDRAFT_75508 [Naegleria gruberi]EFC36826.1 predicted protein [Naegleria gruberi]|eukprot:XP_002669570.1 predicted protein [Naegleria gruberi strain NEG-M]
MKAQIITDYAKPSELKLDWDLPAFDPKSDQVMVRLKSASMNRGDYTMRSGAAKSFISMQFPCILGKEGSGVVERVGEKVNSIQVGDEVVGVFGDLIKTGAYAEFAVFKEKEVVLKPKSLDFDHASIIPGIGMTIVEMCRSHDWILPIIEREADRVSLGQELTPEYEESEKKSLTIVVIGASSGTGCMAVLFAKNFLSRYFNTKVIAVCSERNSTFAREQLGADGVIDYTKTSAAFGNNTFHSGDEKLSIFQTLKKDFKIDFVDMVMDCVGGYYYYDDLTRHLKCCTDDGRRTYHVAIAPPGPLELSYSTVPAIVWYILKNKFKSWWSAQNPYYFFFSTSPDNPRIMKFLASEQFSPIFEKIPITSFSLEDYQKADDLMASQRTVGKIVINM